MDDSKPHPASFLPKIMKKKYHLAHPPKRISLHIFLIVEE